jgi:Spy/CpxP family protein refolding chaperone
MSSRFKRISVMATALLLLSFPMSAVGARMSYGKWWHLPGVEKDLDLKEQEKKELDSLFVESRRSLLDLKSVLEKERFELDNLMEQPALEEGAAVKQFEKLEKARAALAAERFRFLLGVRKILGSVRYQSLKMLFREYREKKKHLQK